MRAYPILKLSFMVLSPLLDAACDGGMPPAAGPNTIWRREWRALTYLAPLGILISFILIPVFHIYGGHRRAFLRHNPHCLDKARTPLALLSTWGGKHGQPLVLVHITDIHVNDVDGGLAKGHFRRFVRTVLPVYAPYTDAVLVTGDLVSSKEYPSYLRGLLGHHSRQIESEWQWYNATVSDTIQRLNISRWITVPGNHDTFGSSSHQFYSKYGMHHASEKRGNYSRIHRTTVRGHALIGVDATLSPSPHRPMNFFGMVRSDMNDELHRHLRIARAERIGGASIVFGHYPSGLMTRGNEIRQAFQQVDKEFPHQPSSNLYLSGHLHDLKGYARYGLQASAKSGHLELQLADMFTSGSYRILAIDHGLPAWKDLKVSQTLTRPMILVTNPPSPDLAVGGSCRASMKSTHIRFLLFPTEQPPPDALSLFIDGTAVGTAIMLESRTGGVRGSPSLVYAAPWNPRDYLSSDIHVLEVRDDSTNNILASHNFALSGHVLRSVPWSPWHVFAGAYFSLSEFDKIGRICVWCGLFFAACFAVAALLVAQRVPSGIIGLLALICTIAFGPVLITQNLTDMGGWGWVSFRSLQVRDGELRGGTDPFFSMFPLVFLSIVPSTYVLLATALSSDLSSSLVIICIRLISIAKCVLWTLNVAGAHGTAAFILSPSCTPLTLMLIQCHVMQVSMFVKRKIK
jgi:Calcineurin-like phosphoesterase